MIRTRRLQEFLHAVGKIIVPMELTRERVWGGGDGGINNSHKSNGREFQTVLSIVDKIGQWVR